MHTPRTGSSPPPRHPLSLAHFLPGSSMALPGARAHPSGRPHLPARVLGAWARGGAAGGRKLALPPLPFLPALFLGHPEAQFLGMLTGRWVTNLTQLLSGQLLSEVPTQLETKTTVGGRGGGGRRGWGREWRAEESSRTSMEPCGRVRVAKCQMLATSLFVLVTGRLGRSTVYLRQGSDCLEWERGLKPTCCLAQRGSKAAGRKNCHGGGGALPWRFSG